MIRNPPAIVAGPNGEEAEIPISPGLRAALKDIAFGSIAGMVSEIFEYPFDLAKVRLQSQLLSPSISAPRFKGPIDCLFQTWRDEGFRGLYRGLPAPILGSMAETASLFLTYTAFQNLIHSYTHPSSSRTSSPDLSIPQLALAAAGAGFVTSFILTPIELVKCKMQVQMMHLGSPTPAHIPPIHVIPPLAVPLPPQMRRLEIPYTSTLNFTSNINPRTPLRILSPLKLAASTSAAASSSHSSTLAPRRLNPPGPLKIVTSTIRDHGFRGLWVGHTGTLLRETGGTAAWFAVKEWVAGGLKDRRLRGTESVELTDPTSNSRKRAHIGEATDDLLPWESAVSGAISGAACVLALYPADTIKSAMQTREEMRPSSSSSASPSSFFNNKPPSFWKTCVQMYKIHGIRGLYAGCGMTVARALPSSAIVFVTYDGLSAWVG